MTDSMSIHSRSTSTNPSLNDIQRNDLSSFDVVEAMVAYDDTPDSIDILHIDAADDLSALIM